MRVPIYVSLHPFPTFPPTPPLQPPQVAFDNAVGKYFELATADGSGVLTSHQAKTLLSTAGISDETADQVITAQLEEANGDGSLDMGAFKKVALAAKEDKSLEEFTASIKFETAELISADPNAAWTAACSKVSACNVFKKRRKENEVGVRHNDQSVALSVPLPYSLKLRDCKL